MGHYILKDLDSQQKTLSKGDYDLRVTNLARFIHRKIKPLVSSENPNLIDIGAGNGLVLRFFQKLGYRVTGMELSRELCDAMRKNPAMKGIKVFQGNISKVKGNGEYDVVLASDVVEHIKDDQKALKNLFSFVAPGGLLVVSVPAHPHLFGKRDVLWGHFRRYSKSELNKRLDELHGNTEFITFWNFLGYFAYLFYEKVLNKPIREDFRYKKSFGSSLTRSGLNALLRIEEIVGYLPWGLTLVAAVKKYHEV